MNAIAQSLGVNMQPRIIVRWAVRRAADAGSIAMFAVCIWFSESISSKFSLGVWNLGSFYSAVFDWAAIQTGFLFGTYTYVASKSGGFVRAIRSTDAFGGMNVFILRLLFLAFALSIVSLVCLVITPTPSKDWLDGGTLIFAAWCAISVFTFFSFVRVVLALTAIDGVERDGK